VTVRLGMRRYVVASRSTLGSPTSTSTPGGTEMGVRPSFEDLIAVCEKGRRVVLELVASWLAVLAGASRTPVIGASEHADTDRGTARASVVAALCGASIVFGRVIVDADAPWSTACSRVRTGSACCWCWLNLCLCSDGLGIQLSRCKSSKCRSWHLCGSGY
jgi:hypothetical protein